MALTRIDAIIQFTLNANVTWNDLAEPVPSGVVVIDTDNKVIKEGDGTTLFENLPICLDYDSTSAVSGAVTPTADDLGMIAICDNKEYAISDTLLETVLTSVTNYQAINDTQNNRINNQSKRSGYLVNVSKIPTGTLVVCKNKQYKSFGKTIEEFIEYIIANTQVVNKTSMHIDDIEWFYDSDMTLKVETQNDLIDNNTYYGRVKGFNDKCENDAVLFNITTEDDNISIINNGSEVNMLTVGVYGNINDDIIYKCVVDSNGNTYAVGYSKSDVEGKLVGLIIKLDPNLNNTDKRYFMISGAYGITIFEDIVIDSTGDIIVVGRAQSAGISNGLILKFNFDDTEFSSYLINYNTQLQSLSTVAIDSDDIIYALGFSSDLRTNIVFKLSQTDGVFELVKIKHIATTTNTKFVGIDIDSTGNTYLVGYNYNGTRYNGTVIKLDNDFATSGNKITNITNGNGIIFYDIKISSDDEVFIVGRSSDTITGTIDSILCELSSDLTECTGKSYGNIHIDQFRSLVINDNNIFCCGTTDGRGCITKFSKSSLEVEASQVIDLVDTSTYVTPNDIAFIGSNNIIVCGTTNAIGSGLIDGFVFKEKIDMVTDKFSGKNITDIYVDNISLISNNDGDYTLYDYSASFINNTNATCTNIGLPNEDLLLDVTNDYLVADKFVESESVYTRDLFYTGSLSNKPTTSLYSIFVNIYHKKNIVVHQYNKFNKLISDSDGNIYAVGATPNQNATSANFNGVIVKFTKQFEIINVKYNTNTDKSSNFTDVIFDDNDIVVLGTEIDNTGTDKIVSVIVKFNSELDIIGRKYIHSNERFVILYKLAIDSEGNYIAVGHEGNVGGIIVKIDSELSSIIASKAYHGYHNSPFYDLAIDSDDNYFAIGHNNSEHRGIVDTAILANVAHVVKYDSDLNILAKKSYDNDLGCQGKCCVCVDIGDNVIIAGNTTDVDGNDCCFVVKFDNDLTELFNIVISTCSVYDITSDVNNNIYLAVVGSFDDFDVNFKDTVNGGVVKLNSLLNPINAYLLTESNLYVDYTVYNRLLARCVYLDDSNNIFISGGFTAGRGLIFKFSQSIISGEYISAIEPNIRCNVSGYVPTKNLSASANVYLSNIFDDNTCTATINNYGVFAIAVDDIDNINLSKEQIIVQEDMLTVILTSTVCGNTAGEVQFNKILIDKSNNIYCVGEVYDKNDVGHAIITKYDSDLQFVNSINHTDKYFKSFDASIVDEDNEKIICATVLDTNANTYIGVTIIDINTFELEDTKIFKVTQTSTMVDFHITDININTDGNIFIIGDYTNADDANMITGYLIKLNTSLSGSYYMKTYGGLFETRFTRILIDSENIPIVIGYTNSEANGVTATTEPFKYSGLALKFDTNLNIDAHRTYYHDGNDYILLNALIDPENNVYAVGYTNEAGYDSSFHVKLDDNLNIVIKYQFDNPNCCTNSIFANKDGTFDVSGFISYDGYMGGFIVTINNLLTTPSGNKFFIHLDKNTPVVFNDCIRNYDNDFIMCGTIGTKFNDMKNVLFKIPKLYEQTMLINNNDYIFEYKLIRKAFIETEVINTTSIMNSNSIITTITEYTQFDEDIVVNDTNYNNLTEQTNISVDTSSSTIVYNEEITNRKLITNVYSDSSTTNKYLDCDIDSSYDIYAVGYITEGTVKYGIVTKFDKNLNMVENKILPANSYLSCISIRNDNIIAGGVCNITGSTYKMLLIKLPISITSIDKQVTFNDVYKYTIKDIGIDSNNNIYVVGTFNYNNDDCFIAKLDQNLTLLFNKIYSTSNVDTFNGIVIDKTNKPIVVGTTKGEDNSYDGLIVKFDKSLNIEFSKVYQTDTNEVVVFNDITVTDNDELVIVGYLTDVVNYGIIVILSDNYVLQNNYIYGNEFGNVKFTDTDYNNSEVVIVGNTTNVGAGSNETVIIKLNSNLNIVLNKSYGSINADYGFGCTLNNLNNVIICGYIEDVEHNAFMSVIPSRIPDGAYCNKDFAELIMFDNNIELSSIDIDADLQANIVMTVYGNSVYNENRCIKADSDGYIYIVNYTKSLSTPTTYSSTIAKMDSNLNMMSNFIITADDSGTIINDFTITDDYIYLIGYYTTSGNNDSVVIRLTLTQLNSNTLTKAIASTGNDTLNRIVTDSDGNVYAVGTTTGINDTRKIAIFKFDSDLEIVAQKILSNSLIDSNPDDFEVTDIVVNGSINIIGYYKHNSINHGFILAIDTSLSIIDQFEYNSTSNCRFLSGCSDTNNNLFIVGILNEASGFILKMNSSYDVIKQFKYKMTDYDYCFNQVSTDLNNNVIICGYFINNDNKDAIVIKLDNGLNSASKLTKSVHGIYDEAFNDCIYSNNNIYVIGYTLSEGVECDGIAVKMPLVIPTGTYAGTVLTNITLYDDSGTMTALEFVVLSANTTNTDLKLSSDVLLSETDENNYTLIKNSYNSISSSVNNILLTAIFDTSATTESISFSNITMDAEGKFVSIENNSTKGIITKFDNNFNITGRTIISDDDNYYNYVNDIFITDDNEYAIIGKAKNKTNDKLIPTITILTEDLAIDDSKSIWLNSYEGYAVNITSIDNNGTSNYLVVCQLQTNKVNSGMLIVRLSSTLEFLDSFIVNSTSLTIKKFFKKANNELYVIGANNTTVNTSTVNELVIYKLTLDSTYALSSSTLISKAYKNSTVAYDNIYISDIIYDDTTDRLILVGDIEGMGNTYGIIIKLSAANLGVIKVKKLVIGTALHLTSITINRDNTYFITGYVNYSTGLSTNEGIVYEFNQDLVLLASKLYKTEHTTRSTNDNKFYGSYYTGDSILVVGNGIIDLSDTSYGFRHSSLFVKYSKSIPNGDININNLNNVLLYDNDTTITDITTISVTAAAVTKTNQQFTFDEYTLPLGYDVIDSIKGLFNIDDVYTDNNILSLFYNAKRGNHTYIHKMITNSSGEIITIGNIVDDLSNLGKFSSFVTKFNSNFEIIVSKTIDPIISSTINVEFANLSDVTVDDDDNIYIIGEEVSVVDGTAYYNRLLLLKFDNDLNMLITKVYRISMYAGSTVGVYPYSIPSTFIRYISDEYNSRLYCIVNMEFSGDYNGNLPVLATFDLSLNKIQLSVFGFDNNSSSTYIEDIGVLNHELIMIGGHQTINGTEAQYWPFILRCYYTTSSELHGSFLYNDSFTATIELQFRSLCIDNGIAYIGGNDNGTPCMFKYTIPATGLTGSITKFIEYNKETKPRYCFDNVSIVNNDKMYFNIGYSIFKVDITNLVVIDNMLINTYVSVNDQLYTTTSTAIEPTAINDNPYDYATFIVPTLWTSYDLKTLSLGSLYVSDDESIMTYGYTIINEVDNPIDVGSYELKNYAMTLKLSGFIDNYYYIPCDDDRYLGSQPPELNKDSTSLNFVNESYNLRDTGQFDIELFDGFDVTTIATNVITIEDSSNQMVFNSQSIEYPSVMLRRIYKAYMEVKLYNTTIDDNGNIYVVGTRKETSSNRIYAYLVKLDKYFNILSEKLIYNSTNTARIVSFDYIRYFNETIYVSGYTKLASDVYIKPFVMNFDTNLDITNAAKPILNGNILSITNIVNNSSNEVVSVGQLQYDDSIVCGYITLHDSNLDIITNCIKYVKIGDGHTYINDACVDSNNNIYITGYIIDTDLSKKAFVGKLAYSDFKTTSCDVDYVIFENINVLSKITTDDSNVYIGGNFNETINSVVYTNPILIKADINLALFTYKYIKYNTLSEVVSITTDDNNIYLVCYHEASSKSIIRIISKSNMINTSSIITSFLITKSNLIVVDDKMYVLAGDNKLIDISMYIENKLTFTVVNGYVMKSSSYDALDTKTDVVTTDDSADCIVTTKITNTTNGLVTTFDDTTMATVFEKLQDTSAVTSDGESESATIALYGSDIALSFDAIDTDGTYLYIICHDSNGNDSSTIFIKFDLSFNIVIKKKYMTNYRLKLNKIMYNDNYLYSVGTYDKTTNITNLYNKNGVVVKLSTSFDVITAKQYGGDNTGCTFFDLCFDSSNNIFVCGTLIIDNQTVGVNDAYLLKLDSNFGILAQRTYGGDYNEIFNRVDVDSDDNVYVIGVSSSNAHVTNQYDGIIVKFNNTLSSIIRRRRIYGSTGYVELYDMFVDDDDTLFVVGNTKADTLVDTKEVGVVFHLSSDLTIGNQKSFNVNYGDYDYVGFNKIIKIGDETLIFGYGKNDTGLFVKMNKDLNGVTYAKEIKSVTNILTSGLYLNNRIYAIGSHDYYSNIEKMGMVIKTDDNISSDMEFNTITGITGDNITIVDSTFLVQRSSLSIMNDTDMILTTPAIVIDDITFSESDSSIFSVGEKTLTMNTPVFDTLRDVISI